MGLFDWIKGKALDVPDLVNRKLHPFDEFTREAVVIDPLPLEKRARVYWQEIDEKFRHGKAGEFYAYAWPHDGGDSAYFAGHYIFAAAFRKDHAALQLALKGLEKLVYLGPDDRLSRGADVIGGKMAVGDPNRTYYKDEGYVYHQDCSESSLIGVLWGCWAVLYAGPDALHGQAKMLLDRLATQVLKDGSRLLNQDGSPARFGDLRPGVKTAPIRLGTLAALLLMAHAATGRSPYRQKYEEIAKRHMGSLTHLETHFLWIHPYYQDVLAYQVYFLLANLDGYRKPTFARSIELLWERTNQEGNPLYHFLAQFVLKKIPHHYLDEGIKTLREFNSDPKRGRTAKRPGSVDLTGTKFDDGFKWGPSWLRGGKSTARQPVPVHLRPSADYFWQRSPYSLKGHSDHTYNSLDFCEAFYLGRHMGVL